MNRILVGILVLAFPLVRLGTTKAREILIDTLFYYAPSSASWTSLATYATQAAFDNYSACFDGPLNRAAFEQNAVRVAFEAIGYPRQTAGIYCE